MFPVVIHIRKRSMLPMIEVLAMAESNFDIKYWIDYPLTLIELGKSMGGRLMAEEPEQNNPPNTVAFVMIFKNDKGLEEFIKLLQS